jgi:hypothetical protein
MYCSKFTLQFHFGNVPSVIVMFHVIISIFIVGAIVYCVIAVCGKERGCLSPGAAMTAASGVEERDFTLKCCRARTRKSAMLFVGLRIVNDCACPYFIPL